MGGKRSGLRLRPAEKTKARQLAAQGHTLGQIAQALQRSSSALEAVVVTGSLRDWEPAPGRLSALEREEISLAMVTNESFRSIAGRLGRAVTTIADEVHLNGGRRGYRATNAHRRAQREAHRTRPAKLAHPPLRAVVTACLEALWSPEEIAHFLRGTYRDDPMMQVSHETIYKTLYVQGRGELRKELTRCLRSGRTKRRAQGRVETRSQIIDMTMIRERPAEVEDRAVPGHWEGDLIIGANQASAVGTLVERTTRFVILLALPDGRNATAVRAAMTEAIKRLPGELVKSITWDQGREMAQHAQFTLDTGITVYFCDPRSPWQRGTNENTNGLLRDYLPKGYNYGPLTQDNLDVFAHSLNTRPRKTLAWATPHAKMMELVGLAA